MKPRTATAIRFDADLHDRLRDTASAYGLAVNWLVNRAVAEFLDNLLPLDEIVWTRRTTGPETASDAGPAIVRLRRHNDEGAGT